MTDKTEPKSCWTCRNFHICKIAESARSFTENQNNIHNLSAGNDAMPVLVYRLMADICTEYSEYES